MPPDDDSLKTLDDLKALAADSSRDQVDLPGALGQAA